MQGMLAARTGTHIKAKIGEPVWIVATPAITNADAPATVQVKVSMAFIVAPLMHLVPTDIRRALSPGAVSLPMVCRKTSVDMPLGIPRHAVLPVGLHAH